MTRALIVCQPPDGGAAENAVALCEGLGAHGFETELAGPREARRHGRLEAAGIRVHRLGLEPGFAPRPAGRAVRELLGVLRAGSFDLVHAISAPSGVVTRLAARRARIPAVYSPQSFPFVGEFGRPRRLAATAIERALGPLTAAVLCVSEDERRVALAKRIVPARRAHVVLNGSPPCDDGTEPAPELLALRGDGVLAVAVAALRPQKRLDVLIDAAPRVFAAVPDARIAIVGDGPLHGELEGRAAALGLDRDPRWAMLPFSAPPDRHLRAADVSVLPSSWEGLPFAVLEAMACGLPQVATAVGGTPEALTPETGVLVEPDDPVALARALGALLGDPERRAAMGAAARARHAARFTVDRMVAGTAALYRDVLALET